MPLECEVGALSTDLKALGLEQLRELESGVDIVRHWGDSVRGCSAGRVMKAIAERDFEACVAGVAGEEGCILERLAIAYGLMRMTDDTGRRPTLVLETLEQIGVDVTPGFAEAGGDAYLVFAAANALLAGRGHELDPLMGDMALRALARLWESAFDAAPGMDQFVLRSLLGRTGKRNLFVTPPGRGLKGEALGKMLVEQLDLLESALSLRMMARVTVGPMFQPGVWHKPVGHVFMDWGMKGRLVIEIHAREERISDSVKRVSVLCREMTRNEPIGELVATLLCDENGHYDAHLGLSEGASLKVQELVNAVFLPEDVVGMYPRVRQMIEDCGDCIAELLVVEEIYVKPGWRQRQLGQLMLRQMLKVWDTIDMVLIDPAPPTLSAGEMNTPMLEAAYASGKLRLSGYWARAGMTHLINGVMGLDGYEIARLIGKAERERMSTS